MDQRQRELERDASAGDVEAAAAVLRERIRSGELTQEHVELAASLGHTGARVLCPDVAEMSAALGAEAIIGSSLPSWARFSLSSADRIGSLLLPNDPLNQEEEAQRDVVYLQAVQRELVPWALGLGEPVRDRVEARQREAAE